MNRDTQAVLETAAAASIRGTMKFPQIVGMLADAGVERYHADYSRHEKTFYLPDGDSHVTTIAMPVPPVSARFDAAAVEAAIRASQRGACDYPEFVRRTTAAGCVGYFVQITGRRAIYFGRDGETHVEPFPSPAPATAAV